MVPFSETTVDCVQTFISNVKQHTEGWDSIAGCSAWFRGQADGTKPPLPGIFRPGTHINELAISERFRNLAPMFGATPQRDLYDEWLYLMQHVGLPTRLLDWSEGALIGLYFAVQQASDRADPAVWMLHPIELNQVTIGERIFPDSRTPAFMNRCDMAFGRFKGAPRDSLHPISIIPTYVHPRMRSQRGCFTLHGSSSADFEKIATETSLAADGYFRKYVVPRDCAVQILSELRLLGVTHSTLFPDHDGLAVDLKQAFREKSEMGPRPTRTTTT